MRQQFHLPRPPGLAKRCSLQEPLPVILNPAARSARASGLAERIRALRPAPELHFTRSPGDARRLARELAALGHKIVVAAGGDGTVNEAVNGLMEHNLTVSDPEARAGLGVLPAGTMNVFALELGLTGGLEKCWERISRRELRGIDLWQANGQFFLQLAGVGLDAEIVRQTTWELKKKFGPLSYLMTGLRVLGKQPPQLNVIIEGRPPLPGSIVLVGNGRHYGGPVPVFPNAKNDDGLLDLIIFHRQHAIEALQFITALTLTGYEQCGDLDYLQAREFRVECDPGVAFQLDGEFAGHAPVDFKAAPFPLSVAV
jgi:diacylglycerol kinase (ATP)